MAFKVKEVPLTGRLRTSVDPTGIGANDFQVLKNLRYGDVAPKGIGGQTKINTTALANVNIKSGVHFRKDFPSAESHVVVAAQDGSNANQKVYTNDTAIPSAGNFDATSLFTAAVATSSVGKPRFAVGPNGSLMMCNGRDSAIWYGSETPIGGYLDWDSVSDSYKYDYLEQLSNNLTTDVAKVHRYSDTVDANTMLLLHLDNNVTDSSPTTAHTVTNNNVTFNTVYDKFGSYCGAFNGSTGDLTIPDNADFDFSGGEFSIDFWFVHSGVGTIFYQQTDANNYIQLDTYLGGPYGITPYIRFKIVSATTTVVSLSAILYTSAMTHVAIVENGDDWYMFINGSQAAYANDTDRAANYTGTVYIGSKAGTDYVTGYIDEFRISNSARWTGSFSPPTKAFGSGNITSLFVASPLPAQGIKFYVQTANAGAGTASVYYWDGNQWAAVSSLSDGTASGGVSLAKTGTMSFTSTVSTAKRKNVNDVITFWYKIEITEVDTTTELYQVTLDCPMQQIQDLWDGVYRPVDVFLMYDGSTAVYNNWSPNVFEDAVDTSNEGTFSKLGGLTFADDYLYVASIDQLQAFKIGIQGGFENTNECTLVLEYWDGANWVGLSVADGTSVNDISFGKSGTISWNSPERTTEFRTSIAGISGKVNVLSAGAPIDDSTAPFGTWGGNRQRAIQSKVNQLNGVGVKKPAPVVPVDLFYYRLSFVGNGTTTAFPTEAAAAGVHVFSIQTIPAPTDVRGYTFPLHHDGSVLLCGNKDAEPGAVIVSAQGRPQVYNGEDSFKHYLGNGEELVSGASFTNQFGANRLKIALICSQTGTHRLSGEFPYAADTISDVDGCVAPESMDIGEVEISQGFRRKVAVWVSQRGVVLSDGTFIREISEDISDKFDPNHANYLGSSAIATAYGRIDPVLNEYHLVIPNASELVFDFTKGKWFEIDRGSSARLNGCFPVYDTSGTGEMYGFTNTGFLMRLENGTTFARDSGTNNITGTIRIADIGPMEDYISQESFFRGFKLVQVAKNNTANSVAVTHFGDAETSGTSITAFSPNNSGYRIKDHIKMVRLGPNVFHSMQFSLTTDDETFCFEPLMLVVYYEPTRQDTR